MNDTARLVLTEADALADLHGHPRPDNPTVALADVPQITARIAGYRQLTDEEQKLINDIKAMGSSVEVLCERLFQFLMDQGEAGVNTEFERFNPHLGENETIDLNTMGLRWCEQAILTLQTGFMQLTRCVARPTNF